MSQCKKCGTSELCLSDELCDTCLVDHLDTQLAAEREARKKAEAELAREIWVANRRMIASEEAHLVRVEQIETELDQLREVAKHAKTVIEYLEEHSPGIISHLIDTDDSPVQLLRNALAAWKDQN